VSRNEECIRDYNELTDLLSPWIIWMGVNKTEFYDKRMSIAVTVEGIVNAYFYITPNPESDDFGMILP